MNRQVYSLDGEWGFVPSDGPPPHPSTPGLEQITVPGLWEAQGRLGLDGFAWYVREFEIADESDYWSVCFGAVMDDAEVYLNDQLVGSHRGGYTPFRCDVSGRLRNGRNVLAIRVHDVPAGTPAHLLSAHGKQGWKNDMFPSPPSLYLTYGGIWQSVSLVHHRALRIEDVFINSDPARPSVRVAVRNHGKPATALISVTVAGHEARCEVMLDEVESAEVTLPVTLTGLARWSPDSPALHDAFVRLSVDGSTVDEATTRFGVRTIEIRHDRLLLNGEPLRMQSALVQGYRADTLYAEGSRSAIEAEVRAAKAIGLNTLRLHIKAFDPAYLDVCDELGMLVHCDLPIAEPLAVDELDDTGPLAEASLQVAAEQVARDRNHPSVVLWSVMNEIGAENTDRNVRASSGYRRFVDRLYRTVMDLDGTRPVIENDTIEPDPEHVYRSPVLTAHWYGRLSRDYLLDLVHRIQRSVDPARVLFVSEFGDWALPSLNGPAERPFWWPEHLRRDIEALPWPGSVADFIDGTQAYKGIADRLQIELFRRDPGVAGWCLTQLTDVPHEYNGLWELDRSPKTATLRELSAASRPTLPTLIPVSPQGDFLAWNAWAGESLEVSVVVSHDESGTVAGQLHIGFDGQTPISVETTLAPHTTTCPRVVAVPVPAQPGEQTLSVTWTAHDGTRVENRYELGTYSRREARSAVEVFGSSRDVAALAEVGVINAGTGPLVVGEGHSSAESAVLVEDALRAGRNVLVLAQDAAASAHLPLAASATDLATEWGSLPYFFSTGRPLLSALPPGTVVTTELLGTVPRVVYTSLGGREWPDELYLGVYKPAPGRVTGAVVASVPVHNGRLWLCQLPLTAAVLRGDPAACATMVELLEAVTAQQSLVESDADEDQR
jgi:hypothetical protein